MQIAVLGTGPVGQALAGGLAALGHTVRVGTRDPAATLARTDDEGQTQFAGWLTANEAASGGVSLATFEDACADAEVVVNASGGDVCLDVLRAAGDLGGKVLLDVSNPLDHSRGFPPRLFVANDDSLGETIQRTFPTARVVKSLSTMNNRVMVDPRRLGEPTTVFVSGDDADAKATVTSLLEALGHGDVIDLGDITTARGPEMFLPLWVRTAMVLGGSDFNLRIVRGPGLTSDS